MYDLKCPFVGEMSGIGDDASLQIDASALSVWSGRSVILRNGKRLTFPPQRYLSVVKQLLEETKKDTT